MSGSDGLGKWEGIRSPTQWYKVIDELDDTKNSNIYVVTRVSDKPDNYTVTTGGGQLYTLKMIKSDLVDTADEDSLRMFLQARDFLETTDHPSIVSVKDIGFYKHRPFHLYEYRQDRLDDIIESDREVKPLQIVSYAFQLSSALAELQQSEVVHRDIKPSNILINGHDCVLIDFELMTYKKNYIALYQNDKAFTSQYPAPEFAEVHNSDRDELGTKANVFQLGLVLAELFTGENPSAGTTYDQDSDIMEYDGTDNIQSVNIQDPYNERVQNTLDGMVSEDEGDRITATDAMSRWEEIFSDMIRDGYSINDLGFS